ncbi:rhodanese-like domain-containing protein [Marinobacterium jannaschii]|uniref:rhodanese-like domain-containing protein n=1 Tax=Marinobacterium jannaschii TaxID=64970 RepID=UPI0004846766|nr:rhodanese-like domain-containing protein [Marinobacterium jannaschii]
MNIKHWLQWLPFGKVPQLDPASLSPAQLQQYLIVDVRTGTEWRQSHIAGSHNLPLHRFSINAALFQPRTRKPVLCICLSAHRSTPAVRKLREAGIEAYELKGGMLRWWRLGLPTERSR